MTGPAPAVVVDAASTTPRVVVLGDVMTDVLVSPAGPLRLGSDTAARISYAGGGSAANVAVWLAAGGVPVSFVGRVGADTAGEIAVATLRAAAVEAHVVADVDRATGTCVVLIGPDGERTMLPDRGANDALAPADLAAALFRPGRHLHVAGYALLGEGSRGAALSALELAARARMTVSVTPSSVAPLLAVGAERFLTWTRGAHLVIANADEAEALTGRSEPAAAAGVLAEHYREAVVTAGPAGAVWSDGLVVATAAAPRVDVVDTAGAGDAFTAGFLAEWLRNPEPESALSAATRLAAIAVRTRGARPHTSVPT